MTDQPTTWTPERALAMLRDWGLPTPEFCRKWPMEIDTIEVAIAALESAAAEIERQRARASVAEACVGTLRGLFDCETINVKDASMEQHSRDIYAAANRESERQKARADALERDLREIADGCGVGVPDQAEAKRRIIALKGEVERLRAELAATIRMTDESVRLAVRDERKAIEAEQAAKVEAWNTVEHGKPAEAAQQGPSDEEIRDAINKVEWVGTIGNFAQAIRMVARRAGVKL